VTACPKFKARQWIESWQDLKMPMPVACNRCGIGRRLRGKLVQPPVETGSWGEPLEGRNKSLRKTGYGLDLMGWCGMKKREGCFGNKPDLIRLSRCGWHEGNQALLAADHPVISHGISQQSLEQIRLACQLPTLLLNGRRNPINGDQLAV
jgi:hypothetical protein